MATPRDLRSGRKGNRLVGVNDMVGYMLPPDQSVMDVLNTYDELLKSEGIDQTSRGFDEASRLKS